MAAYGAIASVGVATGEGVHLVAWVRHGINPKTAAMRVRASDGALLDSTDILLATGGGTRDCYGGSVGPAVSFTGGVFLVAWPTSYKICAVRVRPDGTVLDRPPIVVAANTFNLDAPAVSADGNNFLVAWGDGRTVDPPSFSTPPNADNVYAARVRASDGAPLDGDGFAISNLAGPQKTPAVAFDGNNFFVAWADYSTGAEMFGARVRPSDRALLDTPPIRLANGMASVPSVAFNGTHLVTVWNGGSNLVGRRIDPASGGLVDPAPITMHTGIVVPFNLSQPVVGHNGNSFAVAWRGASDGLTDRARIHARRFDNALSPLGPSVVLDDRAAPGNVWTRQAISSVPGKHFVAWNNSLLHGATVDAATGGLVGAQLVLSRHAPRQTFPSASFDGLQHLVVWHEWNGAQFQIRATRLRDSDGSILDPGSLAISPASNADQIHPFTASNGRNHLVLWWERTGLRAVRVRGVDGALLDNPPLVLPAVPYGDLTENPRFDVDSDGQDYLVLYIEGASYTTPTSLLALRIRGEDGAVLDATPKPVTTPAPGLGSVSLGFVKSHYVASWIVVDLSANAYSAFARRLQPDGTAIDPTITVRQGPTGASGSRTQVAAMQDAAAVVWYEGSGVRMRRIRISDGNLLDAEPTLLLYNGGSPDHGVATGFDGEHLLVTGLKFPEREWRLQRVSTQGAVLDPAGVVLSPPANGDFALSPSPGRRTLLVYSRFDPSPGNSTDRMQFRWLGALPPPPPPVDPPPPPPVDAPAPPPQDAAPPPPVDAPAPMVDAPAPMVDASVDASAPADASGPPDVGSNPDVPSGEVAADGSPVATDAPGADAARDGAVTDAARDADGGRNADAGGPPEEEPGCSCDVGSRRPGRGGAWVLLPIAALWLRRRRRR